MQISPQTRWSRPLSRWIPFHYRETLSTAKIRHSDTPSPLPYAASLLEQEQLGKVSDLLARGDTGMCAWSAQAQCNPIGPCTVHNEDTWDEANLATAPHLMTKTKKQLL